MQTSNSLVLLQPDKEGLKKAPALLQINEQGTVQGRVQGTPHGLVSCNILQHLFESRKETIYR